MGIPMTQTVILFLTDDNAQAGAVQTLLHTFGYTAYTATSVTANELVHACQPDLVLIDDQQRSAAARSLQAQFGVPTVHLAEIGATAGSASSHQSALHQIRACIEATLTQRQHLGGTSHHLLELAFRHLADGILMYDTEGRVLYANQAAQRLGNFTQPGAYLNDLFATPALPPIAEILAHGGIWDIALPTITTEQWFEIAATPVFQDGRPSGLVVRLHDLTMRRQAEQEYLNQHQQREQRKYLERIRALSGGLAYDLNNLLAGIIGYAQLAQGSSASQRIHESLSQIITMGQKAAHITSHMLLSSGVGRHTTRPMQVNDCVMQVLITLQQTVLREIQVDVHLHPALTPCTGDENQIAQVVQHILTNAAEALGPAGGSITICTTRRYVHERMLRDSAGLLLAAGDYIALSVHDTGCGIHPDVRPHIFDPFFSTKRGGRGLGLSVALGNVRDHCGGILVDSVPDAGSTFTVLLPVGISTNPSADAAPLKRLPMRL